MAIDWGKVQAGKPTPPTSSSNPVAPAPTAPSGRIDWGSVAGGASPAPASASTGGSHKSFLAKVAGGVKGAVEGMPAGLFQLGKDVGVTAVHAGENVVNDITGSHLGPASGFRDNGLIASQRQITDTLNQRPALRGMVEGFKRTGNEVVHPTQVARNYGADPVGSFLNDAANLSIVLAPVAKLAAGAAEGAQAGRFATGVGKAAHVTETVAAAPALPFRLAGEGLGTLGSKLYEAAAANGGTVGETLRTLKLDPASIKLRREALTPGSEAAGEATGRQVALATKLQRIVPKPAEQEAMFVVGEGQAPALAKLRAAAPDRFDEFVGEHFAGTLSPQAANLAADVAEGKTPEAAARISEALQVGHEAPGGRAARQAEYLAGGGVPEKAPGRAWETGYAPNPAAIDAATEKAMRDLPKAERLAAQARDRATKAADRALNTPAEARIATRAVDERAQRLSRSVDRVAKAKADLEAARQKVAAGEDRVASAADRSVPTVEQAQRVYDREINNLTTQVEQDRGTLRARYVDAARQESAPARADLAQFFTQGALGRFADKAAESDWYRNMPPRLRDALHNGAGIADAAKRGELRSLGMAPDEFIDAVRRANPTLADLTEDQIMGRFGQLYDRYAELRRAPFIANDAITAQHLRNAGISDPDLEALIGGSSQDVARYLADQRGVTPPDAAALEDRRLGALTGAVGAVDETHALAARAAETPSAQARRQLVADVADRHGPQAGVLAGRAYDEAVAAQRVPALEGKIAPARSALVNPLVAAGQKVGERTGGVDMRARILGNVADSAETRLGKLRENVKAAAASTAASVDAAPARLRPVLETNRAVAGFLTDHAKELRSAGLADDAARVTELGGELPTTLKALQDAGVNPDHFIHIQPGDKPTPAGVRTGTALPQVRKGRAEKFRGESTIFDRSVRAQAQAEVDNARTVIARQTAAKIADMPFAARLGQGPLEGITTKEAAAKAGYVAWDPRSPFETPASVDAHTVFLPEHLKNGFRSYFSSPTADRLLKLTYDPAMGLFKGGVLALSPSWHIGNIFGNLSMATIGGGVNPIELAHQIGEAVKQYRASGPAGERTWEAVGPRRLFTAGPTYEEVRFLNDAAAARKGSVFGKAADRIGENKAGRAALGALRAPGAVARKSYALNGFVDNIGRSAVYLAKKAGGASDEAALHASLQAMGDFSRMTPFERRVVRRIVPFYAWQRHITQLALRLPVEAPMRTAWLLHLGDTYAQSTPDDGTPDYLRYAIPLGSKLLEPNRFVPFGDAGRPLEPTGLAQSLSPLIKIPVQSYLGVNLTKGKPFTRPGGTGRHDEFGSPLPTAPALAKQVTDLFPQKRMLNSLTGRDQVVRYDTGDKVLTKSGPIASGRPSPLGLLRSLGVPLDDKAQAAEMAKAVVKKNKAEAKARANYERRLNK